MTPEFVEHIGWKRSVGETKYEPAEMNRQYFEVILPEEFVMTMERCIGFPDIPQNFVELQLDQSLMRPNDFSNISFRWTYSYRNFANFEEIRYEFADVREQTTLIPKDTVFVSLPSEDLSMPCQVWLEWKLQDSDEWLKSNSVKYHWHGVQINANINIDDIEVSSSNDEKIIEVEVDLQLENPFPYRKKIRLSYDDKTETIWILPQVTVSQKIYMEVSDNMEINLVSIDELRTFQNESISGETSIDIGLGNEDFEIEIDKIIQNGRELEIVMNSNAPLLNYNIEPSLKITNSDKVNHELKFIKEQGDSLFFKDSLHFMANGPHKFELHVDVINLDSLVLEKEFTYSEGDLSIYSITNAVQKNDHLEVQVDFHFQSSIPRDTQAEIIGIAFDTCGIVPSWMSDEKGFSIPEGTYVHSYSFAIPMYENKTRFWLKRGGKFSFTISYNGGDGESNHEHTVLNEETFVCMELPAPDWRNESRVIYGNPNSKENELDFWYQFIDHSLETYSIHDYTGYKDNEIQIQSHRAGGYGYDFYSQQLCSYSFERGC